MNLAERRERYRRILEGDRCVYPAMVFDPISARIAEDLGFELGMIIPFGSSATVLGAHDPELLTLSEVAQQIRRICRASSISLMVSAHEGHGNALNVMRTVEELENAGVSGLSIMDTAPIGFGGTKERQVRPGVAAPGEAPVQPVISLEEAVGKMKAALAARQDPSLVILGGTRSSVFGGIPEVIRRVKAYEKVGVDGIHLAQVTSREGVEAVHAETQLPLLMGHTGGKHLDNAFLAANGVRVASQGNLALLASVKAVYDTLRTLRDGKSPAELRSTLASPELLTQVTRQSEYQEWIKSFLN